MGPALAAGLAGALGGAGLVLVGLSTELFGRVPPGPVELTAEPHQVMVIDGGMLRLAGVLVRLGDVVVPARGEPCPAGPDCGARAAAALASLVHNQAVACRIAGSDPAGRPLARCKAGGRDISAALVEIGWAQADAPDLHGVQSGAKAHHRGMWLAS